MAWRLTIGIGAMLVVAVAGCAFWLGSYRPRMLEAPAGVQFTPLRTITTIEAQILLLLSGVNDVPVANAVDLYRMKYSALAGNGKVMHLSGLFALPHEVEAKRLVSFQHGTSTTRDAVPSRPDGTGIAAAIAFAGNGFALVVPDYPGLGESEGRHPYYVADAIAPAIVGMIDAAQQVKGVSTAPVFLAGFSEGGWASLAALRLIESKGGRVLGSAQVAGAYDLRHLSLPETLKGRAPSGSLYLAYAAWGQSAYYERSLDSVLTAKYAELADRLFSGATPQEIVAALPRNPRQMFNQDFLDAFDRSGSHWFLDAFAENSLIDVSPKTSLRLYYGSKDVDVSPQEAIALARSMQLRGVDVIAIDVGPVEHDPSMLAAAPQILSWLLKLDADAK